MRWLAATEGWGLFLRGWFSVTTLISTIVFVACIVTDDTNLPIGISGLLTGLTWGGWIIYYLDKELNL